ncbi:MAG TPA: sigma factor-like helix-turn-helix DNA-binding protein [Ktedonobacteraceae bacterium]|nr:sigma factor-like helix-turn-helix DNA-binding protein [Ktedonobacteraceae bacterium]
MWPPGWMDAAVKRTIEYDRLIRVPSIALWKARQQGTEEQLYALQPESLDQWMAWYDTSELEEPPVSPLLPTAAAPPRDLGLHAQVQTWLSYLSPRAQRVLTLHYGLSEEDERCYSIAEIAREMGLNRHTIHYIERDALKRIRALVEGTATIVEKDGVRHVKGIYRFRQPTLTPEDEALFRQAVLRLREEGRKVSTRVLAHATGKSQPRASAFLRLYRETLGLPSCKKATHEERMAQVAKSYAELETKGERITVKRLADMVHYSKETIAEYMRLRKQEQEEQDAAQAR